jgi:glycosyltransferase involved in cell wall biosynthesis
MGETCAFMSRFRCTDENGNFDGLHIGAKVAQAEMIRNIIAHGRYDTYHFLLGRGDLSDEAIERCLRQQGWDAGKVLIYDGALPLERIGKAGYHTLISLDMSIQLALSIRNTLGAAIAPATGIIHTVAYAELMPTWAHLLFSNVLPCDALISTSTAAKEALVRSFDVLADRIACKMGGKAPTFQGYMPVIPLGVDTDYWRPEENRQEAKRRLSLRDQSCVIVCPARFSTYDKMDLRPFLLAVRRLLPVLGSECFEVVLVGDDMRRNDASRIREYVAKLGLAQVVKIDTEGAPSHIREYYRAADIFVSIADCIQETFGLTVVQAMACGLPVIVSDWDGYKDTVVHGQTGVRIPTYWADCDRQISDLGIQRPWIVDQLLLSQSVAVDIDSLYENLYFLITHPTVCRRFGEEGRKRALRLYAWPVVVGQYMELWEECHRRFCMIDPEEWTRTKNSGLLSPAYFRQFSHYPSAIVSRETQLALSSCPAGLEIDENLIRQAFLPPEMQPVFRPAVFRSVNTQLQEWPVALGELVAGASRETGCAEDLVIRHVMWLIKYGLVKPVDPVPNRDSVIEENDQFGRVRERGSAS